MQKNVTEYWFGSMHDESVRQKIAVVDEDRELTFGELFDLSAVANFEKKVPLEWINEAGNDVTQEFIDYALPLIQGETPMEKENGLPRFARLKKVFAE